MEAASNSNRAESVTLTSAVSVRSRELTVSDKVRLIQKGPAAFKKFQSSKTFLNNQNPDCACDLPMLFRTVPPQVAFSCCKYFLIIKLFVVGLGPPESIALYSTVGGFHDIWQNISRNVKLFSKIWQIQTKNCPWLARTSRLAIRPRRRSGCLTSQKCTPCRNCARCHCPPRRRRERFQQRRVRCRVCGACSLLPVRRSI